MDLLRSMHRPTCFRLLYSKRSRGIRMQHGMQQHFCVSPSVFTRFYSPTPQRSFVPSFRSVYLPPEVPARAVRSNIGLEAWYIDNSDEDQRKPHRLEPNQSVSLDQLKQLGVFLWKLNADIYETDPELEQIRKNQGYRYMDIITIKKETLPDYEEKLKMFFEEHLHQDDEIRYILEGQAYFDVRDKEDRWIRIAMTKGDLIALPAGIYHRFTLDETNYTKAMRLFVGEPVWKAYNRPADHLGIRQEYMAFLQGS